MNSSFSQRRNEQSLQLISVYVSLKGYVSGMQSANSTALSPRLFQDAPFDGRVDKVVPCISVSPAVMLGGIVGMVHGTCSINSVVTLTVHLRIVVSPLGILQLTVECGINNHIAFRQRIVIHSIEAAADHLVGRI